MGEISASLSKQQKAAIQGLPNSGPDDFSRVQSKDCQSWYLKGIEHVFCQYKALEVISVDALSSDKKLFVRNMICYLEFAQTEDPNDFYSVLWKQTFQVGNKIVQRLRLPHLNHFLAHALAFSGSAPILDSGDSLTSTFSFFSFSLSACFLFSRSMKSLINCMRQLINLADL